MSSNATTKRRRPIDNDADMSTNKRHKTEKPKSSTKAEKSVKSSEKTEKAKKSSTTTAANALLTPVSMKATESEKPKEKGAVRWNQESDSYYRYPASVKPSIASSTMGAGISSEKYAKADTYAAKTIEGSKGYSSKELYEDYYFYAPTEPNSIAEWIDPDGRIPTHGEFVAAIKRKCVGMSEMDRSKERDYRRKQEWARSDISRK